MKRAVAIALVVFGFALVGFGLWAVFEGRMPQWLFVLVAVAAVGCAVAATRMHPRLRDPRQFREDALSPWRHLRAAKSITMIGRSTEACDLVLELVPEWDLQGEPVTVRFAGVSRLSIQQLGGCLLHFDYLICDEYPAKAKRERSLRIRDRWGEAIDFRCRDFEVLPPAAQAE